MTAVRLTLDDKTLKVVAPFHGDFLAGAKTLAGKWRGGAWIFPVSQEGRVRELCLAVYGTDGESGKTVTLRVEFPEAVRARCDSIFVGGRLVARATGRDSGARLGPGVILLEGDVCSAGSRANWETVVRAGTVVEILDLPRTAAESVLEQDRATPRSIFDVMAFKSMNCTIVGDTPDGLADMEVPPASADAVMDEEALTAERQRLQERLEAITVERRCLEERIDEITAGIAVRQPVEAANPTPEPEASSGMEA